MHARSILSSVPHIFILVIFLLSANISSGQCNRQRDSLALVDLFVMTKGNEWIKNTNWLMAGNPINTWYGVKTSSEGCVQELNLNSNKLVGPISDSIVNLTELVKLNLNDNQLTIGNNTDSLPIGWSNMQKLEIINLSSNILGGPVNAELGLLQNLRVLNLSLNYFNKKLPAQLGNASNLRQLLLNQNEIAGIIPSTIGQMTNLEEFVISQNQLTGNLPASIGNLGKLRVLSVTQNQLSGNIPPELGSLSNVMFIYMNENQLSGAIPSTFGNLSNLRELWLNNNTITGTIPEEIGQLGQLKKLILNDNQLTGTLPQFLDALGQLTAFHVSNNLMAGTIPENIISMVNLESFHIDNNQFTGTIPQNIGLLSKLTSLRIHDNMFSGRLPESLAQIPNLKRIYFQNNLLEGCIPQGYKRFCPLKFNFNVNANGYNFFGNEKLQFQGDFDAWCTSNYQISASFTSNAPICEGSTLILMAQSQNLNYSWQGPSSFTSFLESPKILNFSNINLGTYSLTVTDFNGCTASSSIEIPQMISGSIQVSSPLCEGKTIILTASQGLSFSWDGPNNFMSTQKSIQIPNATKLDEGTYTVEIQTSDCTITKEIDIQLVSIGSVSQPDTVCIGDVISLEASGGQNYLWTGPSNFTSLQQNPIIDRLAFENTGQYTVEISNTDGCKSKYEVYLSAKLPDTLQIDDFGFVCEESEPILMPTIINQYQGIWQGSGIIENDGQYFFNPKSLSGSIPLTFVPDSSYYCLTTLPAPIFIPTLSVQGVITQPVTNAENDNGAFDIRFNASHGNHFEVKWFGPSEGERTVNKDEVISLAGLPSGLYTLTIRDENGCLSENTLQLENIYFEINIPNVVSKRSILPGNSVFNISGQNVGEYDLKIYDRWGNLVHHTERGIPNNTQDGWDVSTINIQNGVYVVLIEAETPSGSKQFIENLTIIE